MENRKLTLVDMVGEFDLFVACRESNGFALEKLKTQMVRPYAFSIAVSRLTCEHDKGSRACRHTNDSNICTICVLLSVQTAATKSHGNLLLLFHILIWSDRRLSQTKASKREKGKKFSHMHVAGHVCVCVCFDVVSISVIQLSIHILRSIQCAKVLIAADTFVNDKCAPL